MAYYKKDQLSIKTRSLLADYFADLVLISQSVESFRWALAQTQYFNGIQLFRYLDKDQKGYLTPKDFALIISDQVKKILHYAFSWFDSSKAGQITRVQFLEFLFPRQNPKLRQLVSIRMQQEITPQQKQITIPMQLDLLRSLILQIMERQTKLIPVRRSLMDQDDYTIKGVMNCLDAEGRGWITADDFYKFMKNYDIDVGIGCVCGLLGIYDNDMNGKISMKQLEWLVQGLERSDGEYRHIVRNSDRKAKNKRLSSCCTCNRSSKKYTQEKSSKKLKTTHKKSQKQNHQQQYQNKSSKKYTNKKQSRKKLQTRLNFDQNSGRKKYQNQKVEDTHFLNTLQTQKGKKSKQNNKLLRIYEQSQYQSLKKAFQLIQLQTVQIDQELKRYEQQMGLQTQFQMQKKLQTAIINRRIKIEQQSRLKRKIQQLQYLKKQQELKRLQQIEALRLQQMQNNRALQMEVQRNRIIALQNQKRRQIEQTRRKQVQIQNIRLRQLENNRRRELDIIRQAQIREEQDRIRALQIQRIRQRQIQNSITKNNIQRQIYDRQIRNVRLMQTQFDWRAQEKLKALHNQQVRQRSLSNNKSVKEKQYFWRYNNYCQNLAEVADPLGIKQHLVQTQKYLLKSRQIRDQIKKDRVNSLNRYSTSNLKKSKTIQSQVNTQNDEPVFERTPYHKKDVIDSANKWTKQTKLMWS